MGKTATGNGASLKDKGDVLEIGSRNGPQFCGYTNAH